MSVSFFFLIATWVGGNLFKCKSSKKKTHKTISQRGYCPLDCRAMCYFLLHLQNNRSRESNVLGAAHKRYSVTGSWGWWQVSGSLKTRNNLREETLLCLLSPCPLLLLPVPESSNLKAFLCQQKKLLVSLPGLLHSILPLPNFYSPEIQAKTLTC